MRSVCAGHDSELPGWKSPDQVYVEPTCLRAARRQEGRRRARASPRGGVWRKPNPKVRGDLSACERTGRRDNKALPPRWGVLYKSGVYASKVVCLTPGGLHGVYR